VTDLREMPATPPFDPQGDVRLGYFLAGGLLVAVGWGIAVVGNVLAHRYAPAGGFRVGHAYFGPTLGPYAWAVLGLGLFTGALGVVLLFLGRAAPKGPVVLPGYDYRA